jgi:hypothetical protein
MMCVCGLCALWRGAGQLIPLRLYPNRYVNGTSSHFWYLQRGGNRGAHTTSQERLHYIHLCCISPSAPTPTPSQATLRPATPTRQLTVTVAPERPCLTRVTLDVFHRPALLPTSFQLPEKSAIMMAPILGNHFFFRHCTVPARSSTNDGRWWRAGGGVPVTGVGRYAALRCLWHVVRDDERSNR